MIVARRRKGNPERALRMLAGGTDGGNSEVILHNAAALWPRCDGAIVGTALKSAGRLGEPVDVARVRAMRAALDG